MPVALMYWTYSVARLVLTQRRQTRVITLPRLLAHLLEQDEERAETVEVVGPLRAVDVVVVIPDVGALADRVQVGQVVATQPDLLEHAVEALVRHGLVGRRVDVSLLDRPVDGV